MKKHVYPCAYPGCKVMRTEAEGGKIFTVCDEHWEKTMSRKSQKKDKER